MKTLLWIILIVCVQALLAFVPAQRPRTRHHKPLRTIRWAAPPLSSAAPEVKGEHHQVVIIGGGTGGIGVAAQLRDEGLRDICIIEPSDVHYYQPMWTLVGGGEFPIQASARPMASLLPPGVKWIKAPAADLCPNANTVRLPGGAEVRYDYLIVAAGLKSEWGGIPGLQEALGKNGVCSNYHPDYAEYTWEALQNLKGGRALFTQPSTPIKCGGAPQKAMWLADDYLRRQGRRDDVKISFMLPQKQIFGVKHYSDILAKIAKEREIDVELEHELVSIDGEKRLATIRSNQDGQEERVPFDLLHVVPPMCAPDFIRTSPLANDNGFVDVDKETLQHTVFPNVFALGDCSSLPTSKTMAAITAQAPVLVHNLMRSMHGKSCSAKYDGFTSCPVVLGYNQLLMTEFRYGCEVHESFSHLLPLPFLDQSKPSWFWFLVKKHVFPLVYWELFMRGLWFGPKLIFKPTFEQEDARADGAPIAS